MKKRPRKDKPSPWPLFSTWSRGCGLSPEQKPARSGCVQRTGQCRNGTLVANDPKPPVRPEIRDALSWGSLRWGSLRPCGLGLPHALVHFCMKYGLAHGHMVGIMLVPGLTTQAEHDPVTARRLARVAEALTKATRDKTITLHFEEEAPANSEPGRFLTWLDQTVSALFSRINLAPSLQQAGLHPTDLDWIAEQEHALGASFGIPKRRATRDELRAALQKAWTKPPL